MSSSSMESRHENAKRNAAGIRPVRRLAARAGDGWGPYLVALLIGVAASTGCSSKADGELARSSDSGISSFGDSGWRPVGSGGWYDDSRDSGWGTDSGGRTDTGTMDSGATTYDTDTDTDTDPLCDAPDTALEWTLEMRDATGACTSCTGRMGAVLTVTNPCDEPTVVPLDRYCMIGVIAFVNPVETWGVGLDCPPESFVLDPGSSHEDAYSAGRFEPGPWLVRVQVHDPVGLELEVPFTVF